MSNKNIRFISIAQTIGILLVIIGHSYPFNVKIPIPAEYLRRFIYLFHMPLFIFVSGYLIVKADSIRKYGNLQFIKQRSFKLLVPYLVITLVGIFPKFLLKDFINDTVENTPMYYLSLFFDPRENIWGHFWFIPMIFIFGVFSILSMKILERKDKSFIWLI